MARTTRDAYRDSVTGRWASKASWSADTGDRYVRERYKLQEKEPGGGPGGEPPGEPGDYEDYFDSGFEADEEDEY